MRHTIGFIGFGNMAQSIFNGVLQQAVYHDYDWCYYDPFISNDHSYNRFAKPVSERILFQTAQIILICVKPQQFHDISSLFRDYGGSKKHIVSIMAGISAQTIRQKLSVDCLVSRVMPNTPAQLREGVSAISYDPDATADEKATIDDIFLSIGKIVPVEESLFNAITAISGSGPAFVYRFIDDMMTFGMAKGLSHSQATTLTAQTFIGAAKMVLNTPNIGTLIQSVSSPNGTTVAGLAKMDELALTQSIHHVLSAAETRAKEIETDLGVSSC